MKVCKELKLWKKLFEKEISALQRKLGYFEPPEVRLLTKKEYAAHIETDMVISIQKIRGEETVANCREEIRESVKELANSSCFFGDTLDHNFFDNLRNMVLLCKKEFVSSPPTTDDHRIRTFKHECVHSFLYQRAEEIAFPWEWYLRGIYQKKLGIDIDQKNILRLHLIHEGIATYVSKDLTFNFMYLKSKTQYLTEYTGLGAPPEAYEVGCWYVSQEDKKLKQQGMQHLGKRMLTIARNVPPTLESLVEKAASYI